MAEENKQEGKTGGKNILPTIIKVLIGLALIVLGVYMLFFYRSSCCCPWWVYTWVVIRGCAGPFLLLAGLITLAIAKE